MSCFVIYGYFERAFGELIVYTQSEAVLLPCLFFRFSVISDPLETSPTQEIRIEAYLLRPVESLASLLDERYLCLQFPRKIFFQWKVYRIEKESMFNQKRPSQLICWDLMQAVTTKAIFFYGGLTFWFGRSLRYIVSLVIRWLSAITRVVPWVIHHKKHKSL